ncbi:MAG: tetratricopeptide repeat protein [Oscillatoriaceae cyanobacterium Prado104]|jgi:tetratricopeptide (TPR) repeat protein|nr:tetratricopeptide repeat protein [Oscillatoriaceae cyanobacterium Prado104]
MHRTRTQHINAIGATLLISLIGPLLPFASCIEPLAVQAQTPQKLASEAETWQEFVSDRGGFSVLMPGKPTETIKPANPQDNSGEEREFLLEMEDGNLVYYISYTDLPTFSNQLNLNQIDGMFNAARDAAVKGGRLIKESNLTLNEYQGRELEIEGTNGLRIKARMYWVEPRLYLLMVVTSTNFTPDSDRFLNSFRLLKNTSLKSYPMLREVQANIEPKDEALDLPKALNFQQQALEIFRQINNSQSSAIVLGNIGQIYYYQKQYDRALEAYQQSLVIFRKLSNCQGEGIMLDYIGSVYNSQGQYQKALESLEQALVLFQEVGDRENASITINIIQRVRQKQ